jgi:peptide chain release factor 2
MSDIQSKIAALETAMLAPDFWSNPLRAQAQIKELQELKAEAEGGSKYDRGGAVITIFAGAGGDDAEDFVGMLYRMYQRYASERGWSLFILDQNQNDHGGFRSLTFEVDEKSVYGTLKNESGVHRLVRISPFGARDIRQTSFALVEVVPKFEKVTDADIPPGELDIQFAKSGGAGGQNVNKRETAVRVIHLPTNLSVHVTSERSQAQNKEKALAILKGKLFKRDEENRKKELKGLSISTTTSIEWGNQIRSYVLHPYKMVKDHRTEAEVRDADAVFDGDIQVFLDAERHLEAS